MSTEKCSYPPELDLVDYVRPFETDIRKEKSKVPYRLVSVVAFKRTRKSGEDQGEDDDRLTYKNGQYTSFILKNVDVAPKKSD